MASSALSRFRARDGSEHFAFLDAAFRRDSNGRQIAVEFPEALYPALSSDVDRALTSLVGLAEPGSYADLTDAVMDLLGLLKGTLSDRPWRQAVLPAARAHGLADLVHECPFTRHSFVQPRGYPGDAGLLDFVYRHPAAQGAQEAATDAGRTVLSLTVGATACEAVRHRRSVLAAKIDETAARRHMPAILAVAAGHLREAELSIALREGRVGCLLATDQDEASLETVEGYRASISEAIGTRRVTVRNILAGKANLGTFDLIYAAGLYDYLDAKVAARLTQVLFGHLNDGGRLLIPNFLHGVREEAYMEVFMDWYLLYRTRREIEDFARELPPAAVRQVGYTEDAMGIIGYLEIEKA